MLELSFKIDVRTMFSFKIDVRTSPSVIFIGNARTSCSVAHILISALGNVVARQSLQVSVEEVVTIKTL